MGLGLGRMGFDPGHRVIRGGTERIVPRWGVIQPQYRNRGRSQSLNYAFIQEHERRCHSQLRFRPPMVGTLLAVSTSGAFQEAMQLSLSFSQSRTCPPGQNGEG